VGISLSAEHDKDRLVEMILLEAKQLCNAWRDAYLARRRTSSSSRILRNDTLGLAQGGTTGVEIALPRSDLSPGGDLTASKRATVGAHTRARPIVIVDAYAGEGFRFLPGHEGVRSTERLSIEVVLTARW